MKNLSSEARKGAAVLAGAGAVLLCLLYLVLSWQWAAAERLSQASSQHERVAARAAKALRDGASRLTSADDLGPMFLGGETPGLSAAAFQSLAGEAAAKSGLVVSSLQLLETGDSGASTPYRLNVEATGSLDQLRDFLVAIETALPIMFVTRLELRPQAAEGSSDPYPSEALTIANLHIEAYGWRAAP